MIHRSFETRVRMPRLVLASIASLATWSGPVPAAREVPSIEGTYRLARRLLIDGTELRPPDAQGLVTWTRRYRNLNVRFRDRTGEQVWVSFAAEYRLTATEYCEKVLSWIDNDVRGPGVNVMPPPEKEQCGEVAVEGDALRIELKGELPYLVFRGDTITAPAPGLFVDYWERVE